MKHTFNAQPFEWLPKEGKIRDGRYGPVFLGMRTVTGDLIAVEQLALEESGNSYVSLVSHLENKQMNQIEPNVVSYLGYQHKSEHILIFTEYSAGGTLREFIQENGFVPQPLTRRILRQIVLGLEQSQNQVFAVVFLDSRIRHCPCQN